MADSADIENIERQVAQLYQGVFRCLDKAYNSYNRNSRVTEDVLREGQKHLNTIKELTPKAQAALDNPATQGALKTAEGLIEEYIEPLVDSMCQNTAALIEGLVAGGFSYAAATQAMNAVIMAKAKYEAEVAVAEAAAVAAGKELAKAAFRGRMLYLLRFAGGIGLAIIAVIGLYLLWKQFNQSKSLPDKIVRQDYRNQIENASSRNGFQQTLSGGWVRRPSPGRL